MCVWEGGRAPPRRPGSLRPRDPAGGGGGGGTPHTLGIAGGRGGGGGQLIPLNHTILREASPSVIPRAEGVTSRVSHRHCRPRVSQRARQSGSTGAKIRQCSSSYRRRKPNSSRHEQSPGLWCPEYRPEPGTDALSCQPLANVRTMHPRHQEWRVLTHHF